MTKISIITAVDKNGAIGKNGSIPWRCKEDMQHFRERTTGHCVIMGARTWESIGKKPLKNRFNIVVSERYSIEKSTNDIDFTDNVEDAIGAATEWSMDVRIGQFEFCKQRDIFLIGGRGIYEDGLPYASRLIMSRLELVVENPDTYFPKINEKEWVLEKTTPVFTNNNPNSLVVKFYIYEYTNSNNHFDYED